MTPSLIICLRHGEKPANAEDESDPLDEAGPGVDQHGNVSNHGLTIQGWQRACGLATSRLCGQLPDCVEPGSVKLFAPHYDPSPKAHRAYQTLLPYAHLWRTGAIEQPGTADQRGKLRRAVDAVDGVAVVCWEHTELARYVHKLTGRKRKWHDDCFDKLWLLHRDGADWEFEKVKQHLV